jgi:hypothetical protein
MNKVVAVIIFIFDQRLNVIAEGLTGQCLPVYSS